MILGNLELAFLPTRAPWLNKIERQFLDLQRDVINNSKRDLMGLLKWKEL
ncbi:MAG: transposase [Methanosarcinales archaeon]